MVELTASDLDEPLYLQKEMKTKEIQPVQFSGTEIQCQVLKMKM